MKRPQLLVIMFIGMGLIASFQNCAKGQFQPSEPASPAAKVEPDTSPDATTDQAVGSGEPLSEKLLSQLMGRRIHWVLQSAESNGEILSLPASSFFSFRLQGQVQDSEIMCAGSCGLLYSVVGQSYCGPMSGLFMARYFNEMTGDYIEKFLQLDVAVSGRCIESSLDTALTSFLKQPSLRVTYERANDILVIEGENMTLRLEARNDSPNSNL